MRKKRNIFNYFVKEKLIILPTSINLRLIAVLLKSLNKGTVSGINTFEGVNG